jgi:hypothetical protein
MEDEMRTSLFLGLFAMLLIATAATGQEAIVGGGMENESDWFVFDMGSGTTPSTAEFNYKTDTCAFGKGGCLHLTGVSTYTNTLIWQAVNLKAGVTYEVGGAFREMTGDITALGSWAQIYLSMEMPVEGTDYKPPAGANSDRLIGFNSWVDATWGGVDGTFQDDGLEKDDGQKTQYYTAPGSAGDTLAYIGIKAGVWSGSAELVVDMLMDEISLKPVGNGVESGTGSQPAGFTLEQNYPNPFNPVTHFAYSLPRALSVTVKVFDLHGEEVLCPLNGAQQSAGRHRLTIDASGLNSGVYVCRLETSDGTLARKMTVVK